MAGIESCLPKLLDPEFIKKVFGDQDVPKAALKRIANDIDMLKKNLEKSGKVEEFPKKVREFIREQRQLTENQMKTKLMNLQKNKSRFDFLTQPSFEKDPAEGFMGMLDKSNTISNSSSNSVTAGKGARLRAYSDLAFGQLESKKLDGFFLDNSNALEIRQAKEAFAWGKTPSGVSKEAIETAKIIMDYHERIYQEKLDAGATTPRRQGYTGEQYHNEVAVGRVEFETWRDTIAPHLDEAYTFGDMEPGKRNGFLRETYNQIRSGTYGEDKSIGDSIDLSDFSSTGINQNIDRQLSATRTLHFKDATAYNTYANSFGHSESASLIKSMESNAHRITLMEKFGSNPAASMAADVDRLTNFYKRQGMMDKVSRLTEKKDGIMALFNQVAMVDRSVGNKTIAQIGSMIRSVESASKLGAVPIRSAANFMGAVVNTQNATGKNIIQVAQDLATQWVKEIGPQYKNSTWSASKLAQALVDEQAAYLERSTMGRIDGYANKSAQLLHKWGGAEATNNAAERAVSYHIQNTFAEDAGKAFGALRSEQKAYLFEAGFGEHDWQALSKAVENAGDGRSFMTAEGIQKIPDADITAAMKDGGVKKTSVESYRRNLEYKWRGQLIQQSNVATTTAGAREQVALNMGTRRGTVGGELTRVFTQFKTFTLQGLNIGKRILNSTPDEAALADGVLRPRKAGVGNYVDLAGYGVGGTAIALVADSLIKLANGKPLADPKSATTWLDAFGKSGAGGMHVDFAVGQWDKYSAAEAILGPTGSSIAGGLKMTSLMRKAMLNGENPFTDQVQKEGVKLLRSNLPFQNVPLLSRAYNKLQYDALGEMIQPGSSARHEVRAAQDQAREEAR